MFIVSLGICTMACTYIIRGMCTGSHLHYTWDVHWLILMLYLGCALWLALILYLEVHWLALILYLLLMVMITVGIF